MSFDAPTAERSADLQVYRPRPRFGFTSPKYFALSVVSITSAEPRRPIVLSPIAFMDGGDHAKRRYAVDHRGGGRDCHCRRRSCPVAGGASTGRAPGIPPEPP